jgi:hypothetical protein
MDVTSTLYINNPKKNSVRTSTAEALRQLGQAVIRRAHLLAFKLCTENRDDWKGEQHAVKTPGDEVQVNAVLRPA